MKLNLSRKNILVIEDYDIMRRSIKDMLYTLGASYIIDASNGATAISAMKKQKFDIVICDYQLGEGKNGQQILEQARYNKLISPKTIFIIVSGHQTTSFVLNTIEYKPDEYLTKPFNAHQLLRRLEKSHTRKEHFWRIDNDIEKGNLASAIFHCDQLLDSENQSIRTPLLKIRADLAINTGDFDTAKSIYNQVLEQRELPWARMGLGIIAFLNADYQQAVDIFQQVQEQNPILLECYDWLTRAYEALGQIDKAKENLNKATEISPHSFFRQKKLALWASRAGDLETAEKAYQTAINLGQHSIHKSTDNFSGLAKIYSRKSKQLEALATLNDMRQNFPGNPEAELRASVVETDLLKTSGSSKEAELAFQKMLALYNESDNSIPRDLLLDVAKACYLNKANELADNIISYLIFNHLEDNNFMDDVRRMQFEIGQEHYSDTLIEKARKELLKINNTGVQLFQQGKINEALKIFDQAIKIMPDNKNIILNMATILLHNLKISGVTKENLLNTNNFIKRAKQAGITADKLGNLQLEFEKITRAHAPHNNHV